MLRRALRDLECPGCKAILEAEAGEAAAATEFAKCLRRCDKCGIGYSNSANRPVEILADALENVPGEVRPLLSQVLDSGLNAANRKNKRSKFGFRTSEDAVTWTVFRYLQQKQRLQWFGEQVGLPATGACEPRMLLWGVEVAEGLVLDEDSALRRSLVDASDVLNEDKSSRTEPDVVLDFGEAGIVFVEVKYLSGNDRQKAEHRGWKRYLPAFGEHGEALRATGFYELTRNWRLASGVGAGRPFVVVNLAPRAVLADTGLDTWGRLVSTSVPGMFTKLAWSDLVRDMPVDAWLLAFFVERCLIEPLAGATACEPRVHEAGRKYRLLQPDHSLKESDTKATLGGYFPDRIYGQLDCPSANRWLGRGFYRHHRVFFADEDAAKAAGFRPCGKCMPDEHAKWQLRISSGHASTGSRMVSGAQGARPPSDGESLSGRATRDSC